jgi:tetratricopeptide (TPR) repeat protein
MRVFKLVLLACVAIFLGMGIGCGKKGEEAKVKELMTEAKAYQEAEMYKESADCYGKVATLYPDSESAKEAKKNRDQALVQYYYDEAKHCVARDDINGASQTLQKLLDLDPEHVEGNYAIGWLYMRVAMEYLMNMQDPSISSAQANYYNLESQSLMDLASKQFQYCLKLDENSYAGHKGMAHIYASENNLPKAIEEIQKAIDLAPDGERKALCSEVLAQFYLGSGNYELALATMEDITKKYPEMGDCYLTYGTIHLQQNELDKAISTFEEGLSKSFREPTIKGRIYSALAYCYSSKGDYEKASDNLRQALVLDINNPDYIDQYSQIYAQTISKP